MGYKLYLASNVKTFNATTVVSICKSGKNLDINAVHLRSKKQELKVCEQPAPEVCSAHRIANA